MNSLPAILKVFVFGIIIAFLFQIIGASINIFVDDPIDQRKYTKYVTGAALIFLVIWIYLVFKLLRKEFK